MIWLAFALLAAVSLAPLVYSRRRAAAAHARQEASLIAQLRRRMPKPVAAG
jgi:hypothetical protein